jgi:hypothetical protein
VFRSLAQKSFPGMTDEQHKHIRNQFWNAFKHATNRKLSLRDDDDLMQQFSLSENDVRLFTGWSDYSMVAEALPIEAQVFNMWFLALDLTKFGPDTDREFVARLESEFPGLADLPRARQQQRLRHAVQKWKRDRRLLDSSLTDCRPLILS